jgi:hypothetical protein
MVDKNKYIDEIRKKALKKYTNKRLDNLKEAICMKCYRQNQIDDSIPINSSVSTNKCPKVTIIK